MHIKTVNTHRKYECIVMRGNDKGRGVNRLSCSGVLRVLTVFTLAADRSHTENFSLLLFGLILAIGRSPKYKIDGWPGARGDAQYQQRPYQLWGATATPRCWLSNISSEVPQPKSVFP